MLGRYPEGVLGSSLGAAGSFTPTSTQSANFLARTSGLTLAQKQVYDTAITGLVADGVFASLDVLHIPGWAPNELTADLNLISTSYPITIVGSVSFTPLNGYTGFTNANYADPGYNPITTGSPKFVQDSASVGTWQLENADAAETIGNNSASNEISLWPRNGNRFYASLNGSDDPSGIANVDSRGLFAASRLSSANYSFYQNGVNVNTRANVSNAIPNHGIYYGGGMPSFGAYTSNIAAMFIGAGMTDAQMLAVYNRLHFGFQTLLGENFWGDSLTASTGASGTATKMPSVVGASGPRLQIVTNNGVGGDTSTQIKTRFLASSAAQKQATAIIWAGRNNYTSPATVKSDIATMVAALPHTRYLVLSVINGEYTSEHSGQSDYATITQLNSDLAAIYGSRFVDVRTPLVASYNAGNVLDVADHTADVPPASKRALLNTGTLSGALNASATSFTVSMTPSNPSPANVLQIDSEYIYVSTAVGTTVTSCIRGYGGSTAASHLSGAAINDIDPIHLNDAGYANVAATVYATGKALGYWA